MDHFSYFNHSLALKRRYIVLDLIEIVVANKLKACILAHAGRDMLTIEVHPIQEHDLVNCQVVLSPDRLKPSKEIVECIMYVGSRSII
jgi:hypothetical protein